MGKYLFKCCRGKGSTGYKYMKHKRSVCRNSKLLERSSNCLPCCWGHGEQTSKCWCQFRGYSWQHTWSSVQLWAPHLRKCVHALEAMQRRFTRNEWIDVWRKVHWLDLLVFQNYGMVLLIQVRLWVGFTVRCQEDDYSIGRMRCPELGSAVSQ